MLSRLAVTTAAIALAAVGTAELPSAGGTDPTPGTDPTACALAGDTLAALADETAGELPDSPAGRQLRWVLEEGADAGPEELEERFSPEFLAAVPAAQLTMVFAEIVAADVTVVEVVPLGTTQLAAVLDSPDGAVVATIVVDAAPPHRITGLLFQPDVPTTPLPADAEAIAAAVAELPGRSQVLVAEYLGDDSGTAMFDDVLAIDADVSGPIGSAFKLWVLGALGEQVAEGNVSWSDELVIVDAVRSLPSGVLHDCPDGSTVSVVDAAALMIAISDNTATDALIAHVGREAVERQMVAAGVSDEAIERTLPLVTTQEMFHLKFDGEHERLDEYAAGSLAERRAIIAGLPDAPPAARALLEPDDPTAIPRPVAVDSVEWFASPRDLANTLAGLAALATAPEMDPVGDVLSRVPGFELDPATWSGAWFKGGSEPGVLAMAWLLTRSDGRQFVVVVMNMDTQSGTPAPELELIADAAIRLAGEQP